MKKLAFLAFFISLGVATLANAGADDQIATVQQQLKDQGFYYGQVDGQPGPETTAAIRRYQIRNGLQVDGNLNKETLDSMKIAGAPSTGQVPKPAPLDTQTQQQPQQAQQQPAPAPNALSESDREFLSKQESASSNAQAAATPAPARTPHPVALANSNPNPNPTN
ncbi:MAG TPA: peptidoglycan-binding domain-containing protein, partial [Chthoniobacteraceae bacterium]|nr:peptidoglycan-binding domain-containing protein [Chthoniobacteraceae bacterium]